MSGIDEDVRVEVDPVISDQSWKYDGTCAEMTRRDPRVPDLFFSQDPTEIEEAIAVCNSPCPIRLECLYAAVHTRQTEGVNGGVDMVDFWQQAADPNLPQSFS